MPDKKRDSVSGPGGDDASFDRDGGDYAEDEMHDEHRQWIEAAFHPEETSSFARKNYWD